MTNIIQDVKPTGTSSVYVEKPFDEAKAELESNGYQIISLPQFAKLRIEQGKESHVANYGAYTREGFLYVPQKGIFLVRNSPIMANAKEATQCHRTGKEFYLTNNQVEQALADSVQVKVKQGERIPTNRFGENELTAYAFGDSAEAYGNFLKQAKINEMPVWLANVEEKPFARQAWLLRLGSDYQSDLNGDGRYLNYDGAVRGVKSASADEGSASHSTLVDLSNNAQMANDEKSTPRKIISVEDLLNETAQTSAYAPDQIKKLQNILEQKGYVITKI